MWYILFSTAAAWLIVPFITVAWWAICKITEAIAITAITKLPKSCQGIAVFLYEYGVIIATATAVTYWAATGAAPGRWVAIGSAVGTSALVCVYAMVKYWGPQGKIATVNAWEDDVEETKNITRQHSTNPQLDDVLADVSARSHAGRTVILDIIRHRYQYVDPATLALMADKMAVGAKTWGLEAARMVWARIDDVNDATEEKYRRAQTVIAIAIVHEIDASDLYAYADSIDASIEDLVQASIEAEDPIQYLQNKNQQD